MESSTITFEGNPLHGLLFEEGQNAQMKVDIFATDVLGIRRKTSVTIVGNRYGNDSFKYSYKVKEVTTD